MLVAMYVGSQEIVNHDTSNYVFTHEHLQPLVG